MDKHVLAVRNYAADICELFEDLLDVYGIDIPDEDREGNECEAHIYGMTYGCLEGDVVDLLMKMLEERDEHDDVIYESFDYVWPENEK